MVTSMNSHSPIRSWSTPNLAVTKTSDPRRTASLGDLSRPDPDNLVTSSDAPPAADPRSALRRFLTSPMAQGLGFSMGAGLAAGISTPLISLSAKDVGPFPSAALLQAGAMVVVCGSTRWIPQDGETLWPLDKKTVALLAATTLTGGVIAPAAVTWALQNTSAASVSLTMNIEPFIASLAAWPLFHDRPTKHMAAAGLLAIGSGVLCTIGQLRQEPASGKGIGIAVGCSSAWAMWDLCLYGLRAKRPLDIVGVSFLAGSAISAAIGGLLREEFPQHGTQAAKLLGCGALGFAMTDALLSLGMRKIGVGRASLMFVAIGLVVGTSASCAMGQGEFSPLIGASLGVALLGAAVLSHERFLEPEKAPHMPPRSAHDIEMGAMNAPRAA